MAGSVPHHRRSIRLKGFNYSSEGAYFLTLVTQDRQCLFGTIANDEMILNEFGKILTEEWIRSAQIRHEIILDEFVVMPNHFHAIVVICPNGNNTTVGATGRSPRIADQAPLPGSPQRGPAPRSIGALVAGFKSACTTRINISRNTPGAPLWQRNYYEHIIRSPAELDLVRRYIFFNPSQWATDGEHPHP